MHIAFSKFYFSFSWTKYELCITLWPLSFILKKSNSSGENVCKKKIWSCIHCSLEIMNIEVHSQTLQHCLFPKPQICFTASAKSKIQYMTPSASLNSCICALLYESGFPLAEITHCFAASCWYHCWNLVNVKCSVMLSVINILWTDLQPSCLSASLSVLHLGRWGLEALEDWLYGWCMNNLGRGDRRDRSRLITSKALGLP